LRRAAFLQSEDGQFDDCGRSKEVPASASDVVVGHHGDGLASPRGLNPAIRPIVARVRVKNLPIFGRPGERQGTETSDIPETMT
jgi:hypothetical protein